MAEGREGTPAGRVSLERKARKRKKTAGPSKSRRRQTKERYSDASSAPTNEMIAIGAASPLRGPILTMRV